MAVALTYPGARWTPLGAQTETRMMSHDVVCAHTMVGYLVSTDRYFRISNGAGFWGTESHFGVGGKWGPDLGGGLDGAVWQWQDLAYGADANRDGKPRVISFETADNAPASPDDIEAWTPAQLDAIVDLCDWLCSPEAHAKCPSSWLCHQEGIPRVLIPDSKPGRRGLGYHAQGAAERVVGGEVWSTSPGKTCPAARRIAQFKTIVVPRVASRGRGEEDFLMAVNATQDQWDAVVKAARSINATAVYGTTGFEGTVEGMANKVNTLINEVRANAHVTGDDEANITAKLDELRADVEALKPGPTPAAGSGPTASGAAASAEPDA